jgi:hypothetical protein
LALQWNNNYLISLSTDSEQSIKIILSKILETDTSVSWFIEPDLGNQITSLCFIENDKTRKITKYLPLSLKNSNKQNKQINYELDYK